MKIGVVGLGKVGLTLAATMQHDGGHDVWGLDVRSAPEIYAQYRDFPEPIPKIELRIVESMKILVDMCDLIFVCVQTPTRTGSYEFDYSYLMDALFAIDASTPTDKKTNVAVMSTVAPGTFEDIEPRMKNLELAYNPTFIDLGNIYEGFTNPRGHLIVGYGSDSLHVANGVATAWEMVDDGIPLYECSLAEAEIIKMASNAIQSMKIAYVNGLVPFADSFKANIDNITDGLEKCYNHGWIPKAGMPDGGPCRPRDVRAMMEVAPLYSVFSDIDDWRQTQIRVMAQQISDLAFKAELQIVIFGSHYKPGVTYKYESPALAIYDELRRLRIKDIFVWDTEITTVLPSRAALFVIGVNDTWLYAKNWKIPEGSIIYDPWGVAPRQLHPEVTYVRPGRETL